MAQQTTAAMDAENKNEAADLLAALEYGDRVEMEGERYRVISTYEGQAKVDVKRTDSYSNGSRTLVPSGFRHNCVAAHGRGMSPHWANITVVAQNIEAHQPEQPDGEDDEGEDEDEGGRLVTDGGVVLEGSEQPSADENPHQHTSVWAAATNLEQHEDGSAPRLGVEYRKKNGNGTARKAGTVERVEVERPEDHFGQGVAQPTPRIVFQRDDGQRMYVEPDGLYTVGSHAPYVGAVVALTTSTTSTVQQPEALAEAEDSEDTSEDSGTGRTASAPSVDSLEDLAEWVERTSEAHAEVRSTHYSWDIPGFGRQNDPHGGRTAVRNGNECGFLVVNGPRSDDLEQALAALAHQEGLEVSTSSHRATLVPPQGW